MHRRTAGPKTIAAHDNSQYFIPFVAGNKLLSIATICTILEAVLSRLDGSSDAWAGPLAFDTNRFIICMLIAFLLRETTPLFTITHIRHYGIRAIYGMANVYMFFTLRSYIFHRLEIPGSINALVSIIAGLVILHKPPFSPEEAEALDNGEQKGPWNPSSIATSDRSASIADPVQAFEAATPSTPVFTTSPGRRFQVPSTPSTLESRNSPTLSEPPNNRNHQSIRTRRHNTVPGPTAGTIDDHCRYEIFVQQTIAQILARPTRNTYLTTITAAFQKLHQDFAVGRDRRDFNNEVIMALPSDIYIDLLAASTFVPSENFLPLHLRGSQNVQASTEEQPKDPPLPPSSVSATSTPRIYPPGPTVEDAPSEASTDSLYAWPTPPAACRQSPPAPTAEDEVSSGTSEQTPPRGQRIWSSSPVTTASPASVHQSSPAPTAEAVDVDMGGTDPVHGNVPDTTCFPELRPLPRDISQMAAYAVYPEYLAASVEVQTKEVDMEETLYMMSGGSDGLPAPPQQQNLNTTIPQIGSLGDWSEGLDEDGWNEEL